MIVIFAPILNLSVKRISVCKNERDPTGRREVEGENAGLTGKNSESEGDMEKGE
jgi:hypothetical protein